MIFPVLLLLFISNFIPLWSKKILCKISVFLNVLRFNVWPNLWFILENVPCTLGKNGYAVVGSSVLYMSIRSSWFIVLSPLFPLTIFCLVFLSIIESRVLKSPTIIVVIFLPLILSVFTSYILLICY